MHADCIVSIIALSIEIAACTVWAASTFRRRMPLARSGTWLFLCLVALGGVTLVSAFMQATCSLPAAFTLALIMLAVIAHAGHESVGSSDARGFFADDA